MPENLLALAEKSAENDLAFAIRAKEDAKQRMKQNPSKENMAAFERARDIVSEEVSRLKPEAAVRAFKTQLDAVAFLKNSLFKVSKSQFNRDVQAQKVAKNADGHFEEGALLAYAAVHLSPVAQAENRALSDATVGRIEADAELKRTTAERAKLKLEKEQGLLMPRVRHEEALAARALFFASEIRSFGRRKGGEIIALVGGNEARLQDFALWWEENTADWMDAWSRDREFGYGDDGDDDDGAEAPAPATSSTPDNSGTAASEA